MQLRETKVNLLSRLIRGEAARALCARVLEHMVLILTPLAPQGARDAREGPLELLGREPPEARSQIRRGHAHRRP